MRIAPVALVCLVAGCGAAHSTLFSDDFTGTALSPDWDAWRKTYVVADGNVDAIATPRAGFDYGHGGHGRGAMLMTHVGDASWTDYEFRARVLVQAPDPLYNPMGIQACDRGVTVAFRVARAVESWNDPADSFYTFGVRSVACGPEGIVGSWTLSRQNDHYFATDTGWGGNEMGTSTNLATGTTTAVRDLDWNDVVVDVVGTSIDVSLNGTTVMHFDDVGGGAIASGGVGVLGWWENPVTVDSVSVTAL